MLTVNANHRSCQVLVRSRCWWTYGTFVDINFNLSGAKNAAGPNGDILDQCILDIAHNLDPSYTLHFSPEG